MNCCDANGHTLLHRAAQHGRRKIVELLLSHGAGINKKTNDSLTALHLACQYNHKDVCRLRGGGGRNEEGKDGGREGEGEGERDGGRERGEGGREEGKEGRRIYREVKER